MGISEKLLNLNPRMYHHIGLRDKEILKWFEIEEAYWMYQGEISPDKPHAELSSGLCSNGYFDCPRVLKYPNVCEILGSQLGKLLRSKGIEKVDWVVSSAYAAITFGHEVAKEIDAVFANVEKDPADPKKKDALAKNDYSSWIQSSSN